MRGRQRSLLLWVAFVVVAVVILVGVYLARGKSLGDALILAGFGLAGSLLGVWLRGVFRGRSRRRRREGRGLRQHTNDDRVSH